MRKHLYAYIVVDIPWRAASKVFGADPTRWLPQPAARDDGGWVVTLRADGALPARLAARDARVTVGAPTGMLGGGEGLMLRRITWRAATHDRWFPVLDADLELVQLEDGCQLSLRGTYRPPLSVVGGIAESLRGHQVAEACARRFVDAIGGVLVDQPVVGVAYDASGGHARGPA